jgi:ABC-type dipeptide/oligopeptide/nickel transport system permease subunit
MTFFHQIAATIALSAMGSVLTTAYLPAFKNGLSDQVKQFAALVQQMKHVDILSFFNNPNILLSPDAQKQMKQQFGQMPNGLQIYEQLMHAVKVGLATGVHNVFLISIGFMIVGLVLAFFIKELPLRGRAPRKALEEGLEEAEETFDPVIMH